MKRIYLDHNATTPLHPTVAEVMERASRKHRGNPASQHEAGRSARRELETARERISEILDLGSSDRLFFTSGGTEANNWILRGWLEPRSLLVTSSIEHPSITETAKYLSSVDHCRVRRLPVSSDGVTDVGPLSELLAQDTHLVSVMLANNETGVLQPVTEVVRQCQPHGVPVHTDAVQAIGKIPVSFRQLGVSAMTITAHKFHGPLGIGALAIAGNLRLRPLLFGGFQQAGLRPGTESVVLAVGMSEALELWRRETHERQRRMTQLRDRFEQLVTTSVPQSVVIGHSAPRLPHTSNIAFLGCDRQALVMALDLRGMDCSTGSACASGSSEPSPVLEAMGLDPEVVNGSIRFSLGMLTTMEEIEQAAQRVISAVEHSRQLTSPSR